MNIRKVSLFLVFAALLAPAFAGSSKPDTAQGYPADKISVKRWDDLLSRSVTYELAPGSARELVQKRLGRPREMLSPDVWLYDNCQPDQAKPRDEGCDLLIVSFNGQTVSEMKFVNRPLATMIAAELKRANGGTYAAK